MSIPLFIFIAQFIYFLLPIPLFIFIVDPLFRLNFMKICFIRGNLSD
jgi:hypothetical protein